MEEAAPLYDVLYLLREVFEFTVIDSQPENEYGLDCNLTVILLPHNLPIVAHELLHLVINWLDDGHHAVTVELADGRLQLICIIAQNLNL